LISSPLLAFLVIYNSDDPPASSVNMDVLDLDRLAAPSLTALIEGLEQFALEFEKPVGVDGIEKAVAGLRHRRRLSRSRWPYGPTGAGVIRNPPVNVAA
jgi:hypothetical protein